MGGPRAASWGRPKRTGRSPPHPALRPPSPLWGEGKGPPKAAAQRLPLVGAVTEGAGGVGRSAPPSVSLRSTAPPQGGSQGRAHIGRPYGDTGPSILVGADLCVRPKRTGRSPPHPALRATFPPVGGRQRAAEGGGPYERRRGPTPLIKGRCRAATEGIGNCPEGTKGVGTLSSEARLGGIRRLSRSDRRGVSPFRPSVRTGAPPPQGGRPFVGRDDLGGLGPHRKRGRRPQGRRPDVSYSPSGMGMGGSTLGAPSPAP